MAAVWARKVVFLFWKQFQNCDEVLVTTLCKSLRFAKNSINMSHLREYCWSTVKWLLFRLRLLYFNFKNSFRTLMEFSLQRHVNRWNTSTIKWTGAIFGPAALHPDSCTVCCEARTQPFQKFMTCFSKKSVKNMQLSKNIVFISISLYLFILLDSKMNSC